MAKAMAKVVSMLVYAMNASLVGGLRRALGFISRPITNIWQIIPNSIMLLRVVE